MNDEVIKKTKDTLGKVIKNHPPLTDKLLNKPPFRYLHDIMTSVVKSTGFMKGLFDESEMQSENVKDRDAKVAFLQKAIDIVALTTGEKPNARPSKIIAGQEPEKTNEFLQLLAAAVNKKPDNDSMVRKVLRGSGRKKDRDGSAARSKDDKNKDKKDDDKKRKEKKDKDREDKDDKEKDDKESRRKHKDKRSRDQSREKEDKDEKRERRKEREREKEKVKEKEREKESNSTPENEEKQESMLNGDSSETEKREGHRPPRPTSAKGRRRPRHGRKNEDDDSGVDEPLRSRGVDEEGNELKDAVIPPQVVASRAARPGSARPAAPRPKQKDNAPPAEDNQHLLAGKVPNVIVDKADDSDDDFVAKEEEEQPMPMNDGPMRKADDDDDDDDEDHGGLVKRIKETKKEQEEAIAKRSGKVTIERTTQSDATKRKQRELVQKEMDALRNSIQTLTRSANPLGKMMDYVQEDLDSMQKEMITWKDENEVNIRELKMEQTRTNDVLEPLKAKLVNVDQQIADQLDLIAATKSSILRNEDRIHKMLSSITKS